MVKEADTIHTPSTSIFGPSTGGSGGSGKPFSFAGAAASSGDSAPVAALSFPATNIFGDRPFTWSFPSTAATADEEADAPSIDCGPNTKVNEKMRTVPHKGK